MLTINTGFAVASVFVLVALIAGIWIGSSYNDLPPDEDYRGRPKW